jgi:hypothetical protein
MPNEPTLSADAPADKMTSQPLCWCPCQEA